MEFAGPMHRGVYEMVHGWLQDLMKGNGAYAAQNDTVFFVQNGSAFAQVAVRALAEKQEAIIDITCMIAKIDQIDQRLLTFLLNSNLETRFCAIGVDFENKAIVARASLLGSTCDPKEFFTVLGHIVSTADQLDDEIVKTYGGQTSLDHFRQVMEAGKKPSDDAPAA